MKYKKKKLKINNTDMTIHENTQKYTKIHKNTQKYTNTQISTKNTQKYT